MGVSVQTPSAIKKRMLRVAGELEKKVSTEMMEAIGAGEAIPSIATAAIGKVVFATWVGINKMTEHEARKCSLEELRSWMKESALHHIEEAIGAMRATGVPENFKQKPGAEL